VSTDESLRHELAVEQRRANLRYDGIASERAVDHRRHQIAGVGIVVAVGMLLAVLLATNVIEFGSNRWIDSDAVRLATVGFGIAMVIYAFDQERHLRRVEHHREHLVALDCDIASNLLTAGLVLEAVSAVHASVELLDVLPAIVDQGRGLLGAERAVLFLTDEDGVMEPVHDPEGLAPIATPAVALVSARRAIVAITGGGGNDIGVPIGPAEEPLGVLVLPGVLADRLTDELKAVLGRFGTEAGRALANARRYEAAMFLLDVTG
jgi:hypothetical protein